MSGYRFLIERTLSSIEGFEGVGLAGRWLGPDGDLRVGDLMRLDEPGGPIIVRCTGFPLIRWDDREWRSITVAGPPRDADVVGLVARTDGDG